MSPDGRQRPPSADVLVQLVLHPNQTRQGPSSEKEAFPSRGGNVYCGFVQKDETRKRERGTGGEEKTREGGMKKGRGRGIGREKETDQQSRETKHEAQKPRGEAKDRGEERDDTHTHTPHTQEIKDRAGRRMEKTAGGEGERQWEIQERMGRTDGEGKMLSANNDPKISGWIVHVILSHFIYARARNKDRLQLVFPGQTMRASSSA